MPGFNQAGKTDWVLEITMDLKSEKIFVERGAKITTVTFMDEKILSQEEVHQIDELLTNLLEQVWCEKLVLDFCNVKALSSSVLGLLIRIHKKLTEQKARLELRNIAPKIYEVFKITKLTEVFEIT